MGQILTMVIPYCGLQHEAALTVTLRLLVAVPLVQLLMYGCYRLRETLVRACAHQATTKGNSQPYEFKGKDTGV